MAEVLVILHSFAEYKRALDLAIRCYLLTTHIFYIESSESSFYAVLYRFSFVLLRFEIKVFQSIKNTYK